MTTQIRDALVAVHDALDVAPPDQLAFRERVRAERRRRTARRATVALAASVAGVVGLVGFVGAGGDGHGRRGADVAQTPPPAARTAVVPVSLGGRLALVTPDGSVRRTDLRVEEVVGSTGTGVVVVDPDSHVLLVPVGASGEVTPGRPRDLVGAPVQSAHLDKQGLFLAFVDLEDTIHFREVGGLKDWQTDRLSPGDAVLGIDGASWTTYSPERGLVLHRRDEEQQDRVAFLETPIGTGFPADTAELADLTLAVGTSDGVEVFESDGAPRLGGSLGGEVSSLAPRGDVVATATGWEQADRGMSLGVWLVDTSTGNQVPLHGYDGGPASDIAWASDDELVVLGGRGGDELWVCSAADRRCERRLEAGAEAVRLPTR